MLPPGGVLYISVSDGVSPVPVAVKRLPLSHFPLCLQQRHDAGSPAFGAASGAGQVRISRDGSANPQSGDWFGLSAVTLGWSPADGC